MLMLLKHDHADKLLKLVQENRDVLLASTEFEWGRCENVEAVRDQIKNKARYDWGIWMYETMRSSSKIIGVVSLTTTSEKTGDISYWMGKAYRSNGYAKAAVEALTEEALSVGYQSLSANVRSDIVSNRGILTNAGFKEVIPGNGSGITRFTRAVA